MPVGRRPAGVGPRPQTPRSPLAHPEPQTSARGPGPSLPSYLRTRPRSLSLSQSTGARGAGGAGGAAEGEEGESREEHRECVAREVLQTESDYVSHLATCIRVFMDPLLAAADLGKPVVKREDISTIFRNIKDVYMAHVGLLGEMERRIPAPCAPWDPAVHFGDIFFHFVSALSFMLCGCAFHCFFLVCFGGRDATLRMSSSTHMTHTCGTTRSPHIVWTR